MSHNQHALVGIVTDEKILTAASLFNCQRKRFCKAVTVPKYDIAKGKVIMAESVCGACHGVNGVSTVPAQPNLGGQNVKISL